MNLAWTISLLAEAFAAYMLLNSRLRWMVYYLLFDLITSISLSVIGFQTTLYGYAWIGKTVIVLIFWLALIRELILLEAGNWPEYIAHVLAPAAVLGITAAAALSLMATETARESMTILKAALELKRSVAGGAAITCTVVTLAFIAVEDCARMSLLHGASLALFFVLQAWGYTIGTAMRPLDWDSTRWQMMVFALLQVALAGYFVVLGTWVAREARDPARSLSKGLGFTRDRADTSAAAHQPEPSGRRRA